MKPESRSQRILSIAQSKAKMYEYNVPLDDHIAIPSDPARLFILTIGMLGDLAARINDGTATEEEFNKLRNYIPFSARFFDTFVNTKLNQELDSYFLLLGSAAYYLCDMPGSSNVLAKRISNNELDLDSLGLENLLTWLLLIQKTPDELPNIPESPYKDLIEAIHAQFIAFLNTGQTSEEILELVGNLRSFIYAIGCSRDLLLVDLIGAVIHRRFYNSTWVCLPQYTNISVRDWMDVIRKETFITEFWPAQHLLGENDVLQGSSAVIQMPTSSGKTKATEIIIRAAFLENRTNLAVIITPFRALCHEIRQGLLNAFQGEAIFIDELSDVLQLDFSVDKILRAQQVLIATPEKFNYVLRHEPNLAKNIGLIIYDEGHQFDNGSRGITYELLLTSLKEHLEPATQIILISAVISNAEQIGNWLLDDETNPVRGLDLSPTFRSIGFTSTIMPPRHMYFVNSLNPDEDEFWVPRILTVHELRHNVRFPRFSEGKEIALYLGLKLANQGSVAIFSGTKISVWTMCETILKVYRNGLEIPAPSGSADQIEIRKLSYLHEVNLGDSATYTISARLGVFAHHNNVPHGIRLAVEYAMKEGLINFVICTSTLAQGVNLPIRYLIVTSIYQGRDRIRVRDFQNLIGRSGRSGMHTEGSILFADPSIYDDRTRMGKGRNNWDRVKTLLSPSNSEDCDSTLLLFFDPFTNRFRKSVFEFDPFAFAEIYLRGEDAVHNWVGEMLTIHGTRYFTYYDFSSQVEQKINIISAIESYLMANWDPTQEEFDREEVIELARGTLAYYLADEEIKQQIEGLFIFLAGSIVSSIPEAQKRIIFGRTTYGVPDNLAISNWLDEHLDEFEAEQTNLDFFNIIWPLLQQYIKNRRFINCDELDHMKNLTIGWINGSPFYDLYQTLIEAGAKLRAGSQLRNYKIDQIVDICENGFAYEGTLLLGALIELIVSTDNEGVENISSTIQLLQKQLKYGLSNQVAVTLYEMGFADRAVSMELSALFEDVQPSRSLVIQALRAQREPVFEILDQYPSYFSHVYQNIAT